KNSSRLLEKIDRNRTRSSSGRSWSSASSRTRSLNASHDSSRSRKRSSGSSPALVSYGGSTSNDSRAADVSSGVLFASATGGSIAMSSADMVRSWHLWMNG